MKQRHRQTKIPNAAIAPNLTKLSRPLEVKARKPPAVVAAANVHGLATSPVASVSIARRPRGGPPLLE